MLNKRGNQRRGGSPRDGIVDITKQQLQEATDFIIEHNIVTMPDEPVEIIIIMAP